MYHGDIHSPDFSTVELDLGSPSANPGNPRPTMSRLLPPGFASAINVNPDGDMANSASNYTNQGAHRHEHVTPERIRAKSTRFAPSFLTPPVKDVSLSHSHKRFNPSMEFYQRTHFPPHEVDHSNAFGCNVSTRDTTQQIVSITTNGLDEAGSDQRDSLECVQTKANDSSEDPPSCNAEEDLTEGTRSDLENETQVEDPCTQPHHPVSHAYVNDPMNGDACPYGEFQGHHQTDNEGVAISERYVAGESAAPTRPTRLVGSHVIRTRSQPTLYSDYVNLPEASFVHWLQTPSNPLYPDVCYNMEGFLPPDGPPSNVSQHPPPPPYRPISKVPCGALRHRHNYTLRPNYGASSSNNAAFGYLPRHPPTSTVTVCRASPNMFHWKPPPCVASRFVGYPGSRFMAPSPGAPVIRPYSPYCGAKNPPGQSSHDGMPSPGDERDSVPHPDVSPRSPLRSSADLDALWKENQHLRALLHEANARLQYVDVLEWHLQRLSLLVESMLASHHRQWELDHQLHTCSQHVDATKVTPFAHPANRFGAACLNEHYTPTATRRRGDNLTGHVCPRTVSLDRIYHHASPERVNEVSPQTSSPLPFRSVQVRRRRIIPSVNELPASPNGEIVSPHMKRQFPINRRTLGGVNLMQHSSPADSNEDQPQPTPPHRDMNPIKTTQYQMKNAGCRVCVSTRVASPDGCHTTTTPLSSISFTVAKAGASDNKQTTVPETSVAADLEEANYVKSNLNAEADGSGSYEGISLPPQPIDTATPMRHLPSTPDSIVTQYSSTRFLVPKTRLKHAEQQLPRRVGASHPSDSRSPVYEHFRPLGFTPRPVMVSRYPSVGRPAGVPQVHFASPEAAGHKASRFRSSATAAAAAARNLTIQSIVSPHMLRKQQFCYE